MFFVSLYFPLKYERIHQFMSRHLILCVCLCVTARLKFTVVSEPMDDDEECVDVGNAFLDLQELLLTGNDVIDQQIDSRCCICVIK